MSNLIAWATKSLRNLGITITVILAILAFGVFVINLPSISARGAIESAKIELTNSKPLAQKAHSDLSDQLESFAASYTSGLPEAIKSADAKIAEAEVLVSKAEKEGSANKKIEDANRALAQLGEAKKLLVAAQQRLDDNTQLLVAVLGEVKAAQGALSAGQKAFSDQQVLFDQHKSEYLSRYSTKIVKDLDDGSTKLGICLTHLNNAVRLTTGGNVDPLKARTQVNEAKIAMDRAVTLVNQVTSDLQVQETAKHQAAGSVEQAKTQIQYVVDAIGQVKTNRGYREDKALRSAVALYARAKSVYAQSELALRTVVEAGKVDLVEAYLKAKESLDLSGQVVSEVNRQIGFEDGAKAAIFQLSNIDFVAGQSLALAQTSRSILATYHSTTAWSDVSGHSEQARTTFQSALAHRNLAQQLLRIEIQRFEEASREAQLALSDFQSAQQLVTLLKQKADVLEGYRSQWIAAEQSAVNAIAAEKGNVDAYGVYSPQALAKYGTAETHLVNARKNAQSKDYASAIANAKEAQSVAYGAGAQAYNAYLAEISRQQQVAQEEADRQERAAQQQNSYSSSSSDDNDSGSSSSGGSSSSDDSNSYGGSDSDPGDGGGYEDNSSDQPGDGGGY